MITKFVYFHINIIFYYQLFKSDEYWLDLQVFCVTSDNNKHKFVLAISNNRLVASSRQSLRCGNHVKIKDLELKDGQSRKVYLKGISSCVVVTCKVFKNGDSTTGKLYLITNDLMLTSDHIYKVYQKRWKIEEYSHY